MKRSEMQIGFAFGVSGKFVIVSVMVMIVWLFVLAPAGCTPSRVKEYGKLFESHRMPHCKEEKDRIFNFSYCTDRRATALYLFTGKYMMGDLMGAAPALLCGLGAVVLLGILIFFWGKAASRYSLEWFLARLTRLVVPGYKRSISSAGRSSERANP